MTSSPGKVVFSILVFLLLTCSTKSDEQERQRVAKVIQPTSDFSKAEKFELRPGGATTVFKLVNRDSFSHPSANMSFERELDFRVGNGVFKKIWVSSPSSTKSSDGLGPLFNARSCQRCHLKDGRGNPPAEGERAQSLLIRVSIPGSPDSTDKSNQIEIAPSKPEPTYGTQIQNFSVQGIPTEANFEIQYEEKIIPLAGGESASLREPTYTITELQHGPLHPQTMISPRIAPVMIGVGLLESISEDDIMSNADPNDENEDGISGRANRVWSDEHHIESIGRFGWKAGQPTIVQQIAGAFQNDIGISTPLNSAAHYGDCTNRQVECLSAPHGGGPEINAPEVGEKLFDLIAFYSRNLAVPARRDINDSQVLAGKKLFYESGCTACHVPKFVTARSAPEELSFQLIWPYTDLLLHDMGPGLADNSTEGIANGQEWRTAPLWGIGLTETVSGHTFFLHDGRARNLLEAILWHGGEAEESKQRVINMTPAERASLLKFLNSL